MLTVTDLKIVQTKVNAMPYKADADRYGQPEFWETIGQEGGDCEDFALAKMRHLQAMGMPISQMRLATCWCFPHREGYHAVLLVDLNGTTWVLDNRYPLPMEAQLLPYEWHKFWNHDLNAWEYATNADRTFL